METCKHGSGAGSRKPTAEMRQGAECRAYALRRRTVLHLPARHRIVVPALREDLPDSGFLFRTGELPFALYRRLAEQCAGPVAEADRLGEDPISRIISRS